MKIVIAPDSFKGSLSAAEVAATMAEGVRAVWPDAELELIPLADGGEGTVEALVAATQGRIVRKTVTGPLGEPVEAYLGVLGDGRTAVIEMAAASGLPLVPPDRRDPRVTTTYGTGELLRAALEEGCRTLIVGIGGSATNDGGAGLAQALGARLLDAAGKDLPPGGAALANLARIDVSSLDPRLREAQVRVACDVNNPLCGPEGASAVYGPQKGATPEMVQQLDAALAHYAEIVARDLGREVKNVPGAGAAGGLGAGLMAFADARLESGIDLVLEAVRFEERVQGADLILTGEGKIDRQALYGKTLSGVAQIARQYRLPVLAFGGGVAQDAYVLLEHGITALFGITPRPLTLEEALAQARPLLRQATEQVCRALAVPLPTGRN
ncbi:MAG TPA: glycerate kinase [Armatimonadetes bacterium]|nr:glycerate kinase [Armatimonadota bacterium]